MPTPVEERRRNRRKPFEPTPAGWLVTGRVERANGSAWLTPVARCAGHLFFTHEPERNPHWQSGWVQGATCVVCEEDITPIDASWWKEVATIKDIRRAIHIIVMRRQQLLDSKGILESHRDSGDYA